jgi:predicted choloylglycine hydrolase
VSACALRGPGFVLGLYLSGGVFIGKMNKKQRFMPRLEETVPMQSLRTGMIAKVSFVSSLGFFVLTLAAVTYAVASSYEQRVVAGSPDHFMMVRHVVLRGSNYDIGKMIGELVSENDNVRPATSADHRRNRVQREYMARNYPIMYERMRGLADAFGLSMDDDAYDLTSLMQPHLFGPGCSAVFYPGAFTLNGHSIMSRNFDFTTGTIMGTRAEGERLPALARPYIFEIYPDKGYASISICAFDLLGGVLDGINQKGLTVAIFADDETMSEFGLHPSQGIGLHELQSMRYLLDNCANVEEAKEAMLYHKHFYSFVPCQYLVGDEGGNSFVFEFSPLRNGTSIIDGEGPQFITNHPLSKYKSIDELPGDSQLSTYARYKALSRAIQAADRFSLEDIIAINSSVAVPATDSGNQTYAPSRTLWHSIYDVDESSLRVKFYLGEKSDPATPDKVILEYTPYLEFELVQ